MAGIAREPNLAYRSAFASRLVELRRSRGLSQEGLANESGISRSYVGGIERGQKNPALDHLVRLAEALGAEPADLMPPIPRRTRRRPRSA